MDNDKLFGFLVCSAMPVPPTLSSERLQRIVDETSTKCFKSFFMQIDWSRSDRAATCRAAQAAHCSI